MLDLLLLFQEDEENAKKIATFLEQFGPSNSIVVNEFFDWMKHEFHGNVIYELLSDNQSEELYNSVYYIEFPNDIDATAFVLRFG